MFKKFASTLLFTSFLLTACVGGNMAGLALAGPTEALSVGDTFEVSVLLDSGKYEVDSVDFVLDFDAEILELLETKQGEIFEVYPLLVADNDNGAAKISAASTDNFFSGQGTYATLSFKALASGETKLELAYEKDSSLDNDVMSQGQDILGKVSGLEITIQ